MADTPNEKEETMATESNLELHARFELEHAGWFKPGSPYDGMLGPATMRLLRVFAAEGHSGMSAGIAADLFDALARYKPLGPLMGTDDEWNEVGAGVFQNRRCSHVFKDAGGMAYDIQGRIFREPSGSCFTSGESRVNVTFPYTPHSEYVDVPASQAT